MVEVEDIIKKLNDEVVGNKMSKEGYHLSSLIDLAVGSVINQLAFGFRFDGDNLKNSLNCVKQSTKISKTFYIL
uniref:Uncharacterized protein n=1 Tax=Ditylenchus dipsaci TaxID=166011 RepID=A0A915ENX7_9BILA